MHLDLNAGVSGWRKEGTQRPLGIEGLKLGTKG